MKVSLKIWIFLYLTLTAFCLSRCAPDQISEDEKSAVLIEPDKGLLKNFSIKIVQDWVEIKWQTIEEDNLMGFEIQQSEDGEIFTTIKWETAFQIKDGAKYLIIQDIQFFEKELTYRIKYVFENGNFGFSETEKIKMPTEKRFLRLQKKLQSS